MAPMQLLLFKEEEKSETEELSDNLDEICDKVDKLRKGLFKRMSSLSSELKSAECRISLLEQQLFISQKSHEQNEAKLALLEELLNTFMAEKIQSM